MNNSELRIEHYLLQLDRELQALSVGQRAEIVTEIKSHIHDVMEKDPQRDVEQILADLGAPRAVAERYLATKGLTPKSSSRSGSWLKWLFVGFAGFCMAVFVMCLVGIWYISPLIKVDGKKGRVTLFGGLIDVNEQLNHVRVGGIEINDRGLAGRRVQGQENLTGKNVKVIKIPFNTAQLEVRSSEDAIIKWNCKMAVNTDEPEGVELKSEINAGILTLNLDNLNLAKCALALPQGIASEFQGLNGHMAVESPQDAMDISLTNGKVDIHPDTSRVYDFEVKVKNGLQDSFPRSKSKEAIKMKINVINGLVKKE